MKTNIIRGNFDFKLFAQAAIAGFVLFNLLVLLIFIVILGLSFEKLINSSYTILAFAPILNAAVNSHLNRNTTLKISNYENLGLLKQQCEEAIKNSGFKTVSLSPNESVWKFASVKKKLLHMHKGTTIVSLQNDSLQITAKKNLIEAFIPWLQKVNANEINRN